MKKEKRAPNIFDYLDFRPYFRDWLDYQKAKKTGVSLRSITPKLELSGTSFLSAVLKGKKKVSEPLRFRMAELLQFNEEESRYFHLLVQFNQSTDMAVKNKCFRQLSRFRSSRARILSQGQYGFYEKWYYVAVWNWIGIHPGKGNPEDIVAEIHPRISLEQAKEALRKLVESGMIRRLANGYETTEQHLTTDPAISSLAIKNHILNLNQIAAQQLLDVPAEQRQYNTLMFQVSKGGFDTIRDRIRLFQEELRDILDHDRGEDRIYTLAMSLFPNSRIEDGKS